jgi:hypothetical protein
MPVNIAMTGATSVNLVRHVGMLSGSITFQAFGAVINDDRTNTGSARQSKTRAVTGQQAFRVALVLRCIARLLRNIRRQAEKSYRSRRSALLCQLRCILNRIAVPWVRINMGSGLRWKKQDITQKLRSTSSSPE